MAISARALALRGIVAPIDPLLVAVDGVAVTVAPTVWVPSGALGVELDPVSPRVVAVDLTTGRAVIADDTTQRRIMVDIATARAVSVDATTDRAIAEDRPTIRAASVDAATARTITGLPMEIYRGDAQPDFAATLKDAGSAVDLTDASAVLRMSLNSTTTTKTLTIPAPATSGRVTYNWSAAETTEMAAGKYTCCIVVTLASGEPLTWPSKGQPPISIEFLDRPA